MLLSLEIKNFRTFSHLIIHRLGRVNLIVGKNNVGKTTLLEALRIYGSIAPGSTIRWLLNKRNEISRTTEKKEALDLRSLFYGRKVHENDEIYIREHTADSDNPGFVATFERDSDMEGILTDKDGSAGLFGDLVLRFKHRDLSGRLLRNGASFVAGFSPAITNNLDCDPQPPFLQGIGSQPGFEDLLATWWDDLSLTEAENRVLQALQAIAPVKGASFVGDPRKNAGRFAKVRIFGAKEPAPLATLGDGAVRMFQIAVAMEYAAIRGKSVLEADPDLQNAFPLLLIDEVETGIHHTLHADLWRFIFRASRLLDVQVFATTHSHDCLRGFAEAVAEDEDEEADGQVIRLERDADEDATRAIVVSREKLPIVVRDSIEVR